MTEPRGPLDGLNVEQARAAGYLDGPMLVDAGAGSGKTRMLTQRVLCALTPGVVPGWQSAEVDEVLAITFTEKAAGEIGERVRRALRKAGRVEDARRLDGAWFSTIHGLCSRILRRFALQAGVDPAFRVADGVETHRLKQEAFADAARGAMQESAAGEALFGAYGFEALASAVGSLERELHTRGLDADALMLEMPIDSLALHAETLAFFERMRAAWEACESTTATAEVQREACALTASALDRLDASALAPEVLAAEVWRALDSHPKPPSRLKGAEDILAEMAPERTRLLQEAACTATARQAEALRALVGDYARRYAEAKRAIGALDFDDLQLETLRLLRAHPRVAESLRARFRLVMVDEFQDTDALQLELVRMLAGQNLCTVGDERQSIYGFRGADLGVYREHVEAMREAGALSVPLADNYRSHRGVLDFVNAAFAAPQLFGDSFLRLRAKRDEAGRPALPSEGRVRVVLVRRKGNASVVAHEAAEVAKRFAELRDAGVPTGSMAVLLRTYRHAEEFASALRRVGLSALVVGGSRFFGRPEVLTLRALCRAIANVNDDIAFAQLLASPAADISDDALWLLRNDECGGRRRGALAAPLAAGEVTLPAPDAEATALVCAVLDRARGRIGRMPLSEIVLRAVEESGLDLRLMGRGDEGAEAYANVLKFARLADAFEASGGAGPAAFVEHLDAKEESGDHEAPASLADESTQCVRIMSIHASKGLEFAAVALPQLGDAVRGDRGPIRWRADRGAVRLALALPSEWCSSDASKTHVTPWFSAFDADAAIEDEEEAKRLFYVGCTRAEELLLLTGATSLEDEPAKRSPLDPLLTAVYQVESSGAVFPAAIERIDVEEQTAEVAEATQLPAADPVPFRPAPPTDAVAEPIGAPERLSYSDIALYRRCGLRFYAQRLLGLGSVGRRADLALAFGSAVHAALQLAVAGSAADEKRLAALARAFGVPRDEQARLGEAVDHVLASQLAAELSCMSSVRTEAPFVVPVGDPPFLLRGTLDAYGRDGSRGLVVDYKTGASGTEAELRERFALQAACYALVALRDGCERVRVVFVRPEVQGPDGPQTVEYAYGASDAFVIEAELVGDRARMAAGEYAPLAAWDHAFCPDCPAATTICPLRSR
jgi:ATP-dependent exoDNAse (exonuclease V) beta subunit